MLRWAEQARGSRVPREQATRCRMLAIAGPEYVSGWAHQQYVRRTQKVPEKYRHGTAFRHYELGEVEPDGKSRR